MISLSSHRRALVLSLGSVAALPALRAFAGSSAPHLLYAHSFPDLDAGDISMRQFLGKPLVLNFWATWCAPCVQEMPDLDALYRAHPQAGFVGMAVDTSTNVRKFVQKVPVSYPLLIGGHASIEHMRDLGNRRGGLPFTVLFDAQGQVRHQLLGQVQPARLEELLGKL